MRIVIIEDERLTAEDLAESIKKVDEQIQIVATLHSVKEGLSFFEKEQAIDLIFSDIQLGDGLSFEVFDKVKITTPVIFCTAYNEYALNAFKANGIDYILKPFNLDSIKAAITKYQNFQKEFHTETSVMKKLSEALDRQNYSTQGSVLVHYKDKIIPEKISNIALVYIENELTYLLTFDAKKYTVNKTLDELEKTCGRQFYRANRKIIVNRKAIKDVSKYFNRKLLLNLNVPFVLSEPITVGKTKTPEFMNWLAS